MIELGKLGCKKIEDCSFPAQKTQVQQADVHFRVLFVEFQALGDRPHGMAQSQMGIPERPQKVGERLLDCRQIAFGFE